MSLRTRRSTIWLSRSDRAFYLIVNAICVIILLMVLYPLVYVISSSFSSPNAVLGGRVVLWPVEPGLTGYRTVFSYRDVTIGYGNSLFYTLIGTFINVTVTMFCAYPLARNTLPMRNMFMFMFTFTMFFSGGLIPGYILVRSLNMVNTMWALIIPGSMSVFNMIIARTFLQTSIPNEMLEAAQVDGCGDIRYFFQMVLPLSKAIVAVIALYYAIGHWNSWFAAFIYLHDRSRYPLQLILREILVINTLDADRTMDPELLRKLQGIADLLKYSLIVVASVPVMLVYPFAQKYFVKGVMIGSLKG